MTTALEVLSRRPARPAALPPLLCVHGAFSGAWCWAEHFLDWFAERGVEIHAVSLRGHGGSPGHHAIHGHGLADYAADVATAAASLDRPPVLVGHSMGGLVVQRCLADDLPVAGAVLMASVPPQGLGPTLAWMSWTAPIALAELGLVMMGGPTDASVHLLRRILFSDDVPEARLIRHFDRFDNESLRATVEMMTAGLGAWPTRRGRPLLVMGADNDLFVPPELVRLTAWTHGVGATILPNMAHAMMLDTHWQRAATPILDWLTTNHEFCEKSGGRTPG